MSTVKANKFSPQSLPIAQIDGFNDVETYVVSTGQTSFTASNFDIKSPVRAFVKTSPNPVAWTEVTLNFTNSTTFEVVEGVSDGDEFIVYYQSGYYQGTYTIDDTQVQITSTNTAVNSYNDLKILLDAVGGSAFLESFKDYGIGTQSLQEVDLISSESLKSGIYTIIDTNIAGMLIQINSSGSVKQIYLPYGEQKIFTRDNQSGSFPSTFEEIGSNAIDIASETAGFTIDSTYIGKHVRLNAALTASIVIPNDTNYDAPIGSTMSVTQVGAGSVRFLLDSGVTMNSAGGSNSTRTQFSALTVFKVGANEWDLIGDLA